MVIFSLCKKRLHIPKISFAVLVFIGSFIPAFSQPVHQHRELKWYSPGKMEIGTGDSVQLLSFRGAIFREDIYGFLPVFQESFPVRSEDINLIGPRIEKPVYKEIPKSEIIGMKDLDRIG